jgi:hypothetical protein
MKKITIGICCLVLIALMASTYAAINAVQDPQPPADTLNPSEISLAVDLSIDEMTANSDLIAIGSCLNTQSMWVDRTLVTLANISVQEVLKGEDSSTITVALPGGVDANRKIPIAMTYPGAPRITPDEKVFLFLVRDDMVRGGYTIAGFSQGKFSIQKDDDGQDVVSRDLTETALKGKTGVHRGGPTHTSLSGLKNQVLRQLRTR